MAETWKSVVGFDGLYEISDHGGVRSVDRVIRRYTRFSKIVPVSRRGVPIASRAVAGGYRMVNLSRDNIISWILVHRAVLSAFIGPCPEGLEGCHDDGDRANNRLDNLRWDTHVANLEDRDAHGTTAKGSTQGGALLTELQVVAIRTLDPCRGLAKKIALLLNVKERTIKSVLWGESWTHVDLVACRADPQFATVLQMLRAHKEAA